MIEVGKKRLPIDPESIKVGSDRNGLYGIKITALGRDGHEGSSFRLVETLVSDMGLERANEIASRWSTETIVVVGVGLNRSSSANAGMAVYHPRRFGLWEKVS